MLRHKARCRASLGARPNINLAFVHFWLVKSRSCAPIFPFRIALKATGGYAGCLATFADLLGGFGGRTTGATGTRVVGGSSQVCSGVAGPVRGLAWVVFAPRSGWYGRKLRVYLRPGRDAMDENLIFVSAAPRT